MVRWDSHLQMRRAHTSHGPLPIERQRGARPRQAGPHRWLEGQQTSRSVPQGLALRVLGLDRPVHSVAQGAGARWRDALPQVPTAPPALTIGSAPRRRSSGSSRWPPLQSTGQVRKLLSLLASGGPSTATEAAQPSAVRRPPLHRTRARRRRGGHPWPPEGRAPGLHRRDAPLWQSQGSTRSSRASRPAKEIYFGEIKREAERLLHSCGMPTKVTVDDLKRGRLQRPEEAGRPAGPQDAPAAEEPTKRSRAPRSCWSR